MCSSLHFTTTQEMVTAFTTRLATRVGGPKNGVYRKTGDDYKNGHCNATITIAKIKDILWELKSSTTSKSNWSSLASKICLFFLLPTRAYRVNKAANIIMGFIQKEFPDSKEQPFLLNADGQKKKNPVNPS